MKKTALLLACLPMLLFSQTKKDPCETLGKLNSFIQQNHYKPKPIDDSLSVYVFKTFLQTIDEDNSLFIAPEIAELEKEQYHIDNYIKTKDCRFLHDFYQSYSNTVTRYKRIIDNLKRTPFPLSSTEKIQFSKKAFPFVKTEDELEHLYQKRILFTVLREIAESSKNKDSLVTHFETLAANQKAKTFDAFECKTKRYELTETEFNNLFFNTFCSYFDPHTEFFSESEKSSFFSAVSSDNLTFGLYVSMSEKNKMTVEDIIPGSSAYLSEKIDKGDEILKIKIKGQDYEINCSSMKKIEEIMSSNEYKTAQFTLRKKSGEVYRVHLSKKVLKDYQNNVYSFKIKKDNHTFGYIRIPSFYSTFENGKSNVSNDVMKEVNQLKEDSIDGLIIDVENNGGGSLEEAVRLSGLFIDSGPLAVMNNNFNGKEIVKDSFHGMIYDGPMVVMINGFSASASEFFANAMQDYHRALLIGTRTLGKASMQRIFPLDDDNSEFLKLTLETFYRVTGKSNQYIGITPDIEIPQVFDKQMPREDSNATALKNDTIVVTIPFTRIENAPYDKAVSLSKERMSTSKEGEAISALNIEINALYDKDIAPIALDFDSVFKDVNKINALWKSIEQSGEVEYPIVTEQNDVDKAKEAKDDYLKSCTAERVKDIQKNYHILEATNILTDVLKYKS